MWAVGALLDDLERPVKAGQGQLRSIRRAGLAAAVEEEQKGVTDGGGGWGSW